MSGHTLARLALLADALLVAAVLCIPGRARRAATAGALLLTPILLTAELWHSTQITHLRHHPALAAAGVVAALAVVGVLALAVRLRPHVLALLAVVALPFRFSFLAGGTGGILLPLYVVIAAGAVALLFERGERGPAPATLERALAAFVVLYATQALYTPAASLSKAVEDVGFFLVPFSLLYVLLVRVSWDRKLVARCFRAVVALAILFVVVAAVEYASRRVLFNVALNANARFFRVNSLFYDPNILGRFLALTMVLVAAAMLWEERPRRVQAAAALLAVLWLGLVGTVSQSSILALLAGLAVLGAARFSARWTAATIAVVLAAGGAVALLASGSLHLSSANNATSDRASLVREGIDLYAARPIVGYGSGSFSCEYLLHTAQSCAHPPVGVTSDSHTVPVTVAAEQGTIGLIAYVLLLAACVWRLAGAGVRRNVVRVAILAAFVALVVHSWGYAAFLEDPATWALLAAGSALAAIWMGPYLKRLLTAGVAYQVGDILSKGVALFTLPLYTSYVDPAGYGYAETLMTAVILLSILLRLGVGEAFIRFYFDDADQARRDHLARTAVVCVFVTTTAAALVGVAVAEPLSQALLGVRDTTLLELSMLGLWAFANLEIAYALLRADERTATYIRASVVDVVITIAVTAFLVVGRHAGAEGLLAGNYSASAVVVVGLWWTERRRLVGSLRGARTVLRRMLAFGLPTVPADASVYALQVADRWYLLRAQSAAAAGLYALAAKLATIVFVAVRGFQYAWPPLAYSIEDDAVAARLYAVVTTYYVLGTGAVVAGVALLGRWAVRLLLAPAYFGAHLALPWLALGWALYGLYLIFVVISGRARRTTRNLPAALAGLAMNVASLVVLVPVLGIAGAGISLVIAYVTMIAVIYLLTRRLFEVPFEWDRLARLVGVLVAISVAGELALPTHGAAGFLLRGLAWCLIWPALRATGFFRREELAQAAGFVRRALRRGAA